MADYDFTNTWFDITAKGVWDNLIPQINPAKVLEIGSYEGASACYLIDTLAPTQNMEIHCIDTWDGGIEHKEGGLDMSSVESRFLHNIDVATKRHPDMAEVVVHKGYSDVLMAGMLAEGKQGYFDFIYVDGSHQAPDVLCDAVLGFKLLRVGGVMAFDDYLWSENLPGGKDPLRCPKPAIDAFININFRKLNVLSALLAQVYVQKMSD